MNSKPADGDTQHTGRATLFLLALLTALGALLRLWALGDRPPGFYHDEAYYALDALVVLAGVRPIFFEANNGREPLFIYLTALGIEALGRTPVALRLVSAVVGTLTIPATFLMARALFSARVGLLTAAVVTVSVWTVNLSRIGFRAVTMPLIVALVVWQGTLAFRTRRKRHFVLAGALYGLLFYTYLAARFTPLALALAGLVYWAARWLATRRRGKVAGEPAGPPFPWRGVALAAVASLLVAAPLLAYFAGHAGETLQRGGQVSILNPAINKGDPWGLLGRNIVAALGMFNVRGDFIPRHNVPLRPVFDPLLGLAFLVGVGLALRRWRQPSALFCLAWTATLLLPTILAEDTPHFLRAVGILPVAFVFPALGLDWVWDRLGARGWRRVGAALVGAVLLLALGLTWRDYFVLHAVSSAAYYEFETGATELARDVNRFIGAGWDDSWAEPRPAPRADARAYIDARLWEQWPNIRYLTTPVNTAVLTPGRPITGAAVLLALWPFEDHRAALGQLPRDSTILARQGAFERGDLETAPRLLYYTVQATPGQPPATLTADFGAAAIRHASWRREGDTLRVQLVWDARGPLPASLSAFVHAVGPDGLLGQADGPPGGFYPGSIWRTGDTVEEERVIPLPSDAPLTEVRVGLYDSASLKRLPLPAGTDYVVVPGSGPP